MTLPSLLILLFGVRSCWVRSHRAGVVSCAPYRWCRESCRGGCCCGKERRGDSPVAEKTSRFCKEKEWERP